MLRFLQEEVYKGAKFIAINPGNGKASHISLVTDFPKYVMNLNCYFKLLAANSFNNVTQANGRAIKASAMMEFKETPNNV